MTTTYRDKMRRLLKPVGKHRYRQRVDNSREIEEGLRGAIALSPYDPANYHIYGDYLEEQNRPEEANEQRILAFRVHAGNLSNQAYEATRAARPVRMPGGTTHGFARHVAQRARSRDLSSRLLAAHHESLWRTHYRNNQMDAAEAHASARDAHKQAAKVEGVLSTNARGIIYRPAIVMVTGQWSDADRVVTNTASNIVEVYNEWKRVHLAWNPPILYGHRKTLILGNLIRPKLVDGKLLATAAINVGMTANAVSGPLSNRFPRLMDDILEGKPIGGSADFVKTNTGKRLKHFALLYPSCRALVPQVGVNK